MYDNMQWNEELPDNCPPENAIQPNGKVFYRLVESIPPNEIDFYSTRQRSQNRPFDDECIMRSCSIYSTYEACDRSRKTFSKLKTRHIVKIILLPESGVIKQTFGEDHYSWWIAKEFNPVYFCEEARFGAE